MRSLFAPSEPQQDVWSVSELTTYIRELFDIDYRLREIEIEGEISNYRRARSGHLYFTLKDAKAQLPCVMWRTDAAGLRFRPQDGDAIRVWGRVSVYEVGGRYQLYADRMAPAGRGNLAEAFEQLKAELEEEGLFDSRHKKSLPTTPNKIGIVTSLDAAALRDILNVLRRRFPLTQVLVAPALVQGAEAPPQVVRALQWLDGRDDVDTIIVARGGGSLEDLWAFNDERVARAIFAARHPVICGIGHETDFSIADFVADVRAPTPSAAAELAVPDQKELLAGLKGLRFRQEELVRARLTQGRWRVDGLTRNLDHLGPRRRVMNDRQRLDASIGRVEQMMALWLNGAQNRLALAQARLAAVDPQATLARGYAIVRNEDDQVVYRLADARAGSSLRVQVTDGEFGVRVLDDN